MPERVQSNLQLLGLLLIGNLRRRRRRQFAGEGHKARTFSTVKGEETSSTYLHELVFDSSVGLVLSNAKVADHAIVTDKRRVAITLDIQAPFAKG